MIDTAGSHVGQVNGLAVVELGDSRFAHPVCITATARIAGPDRPRVLILTTYDTDADIVAAIQRLGYSPAL